MREYAGVLQAKGDMLTQKPQACTRLPGTPLLFKVRVLKENNRNLESAKRAQNRLTPPHLEPRTDTPF